MLNCMILSLFLSAFYSLNCNLSVGIIFYVFRICFIFACFSCLTNMHFTVIHFIQLLLSPSELVCFRNKYDVQPSIWSAQLIFYFDFCQFPICHKIFYFLFLGNYFGHVCSLCPYLRKLTISWLEMQDATRFTPSIYRGLFEKVQGVNVCTHLDNDSQC